MDRNKSLELDRFIGLNAAKGIRLKTVDVDVIPMANTSSDVIYRTILPNGVTRIQPPKSFMKQRLIAQDTKTGFDSEGIKTLFPETMTPEDVAQLGNQLPAFWNGDNLRSIETSLKDVKYRLQLIVKPDGKVISFYPDWNQ